MKVTKNIMDILSACGCKPSATVDKAGNVAIKVNAPALSGNKEKASKPTQDHPDFTSPDAFFCEMD